MNQRERARDRRQRKAWLGDALLKRTSPVVPWNESTLKAAKLVTLAVSGVKADNSRFANRLEGLQEEMEAAWRLK